MQIGGASVLYGFEYMEKQFEGDTLFNWKPVKGVKNRGDVF